MCKLNTLEPCFTGMLKLFHVGVEKLVHTLTPRPHGVITAVSVKTQDTRSSLISIYSTRSEIIFMLALSFYVYIWMVNDEFRHVYKTHINYCMNLLKF